MSKNMNEKEVLIEKEGHVKGTALIKVDDTNSKIGLFGATPVVQPTALTAQLTTITHTAPSTPDYAIQALTNSSPYGFATADEGNSVLKVVANLQARVAELETKLVALGALAAA